MNEELEVVNERPVVQERGPEPIVEMYDLDSYAGVVETVWFKPDKEHAPEKVVRLDLRTQALRGGDLNVIQRRWNKRRMADQEIAFLQEKLERHKPPRDLELLRTELVQIRDSDYDTPEKAEESRNRIAKEIERVESAYDDEHKRLTTDLNALIDQPTIYELLRSEMFAKVIEDHSIAWRGTKLNFKSPLPDDEPPDAFATDLYKFILDKLQRGKATRRNGGSRR